VIFLEIDAEKRQNHLGKSPFFVDTTY